MPTHYYHTHLLHRIIFSPCSAMASAKILTCENMENDIIIFVEFRVSTTNLDLDGVRHRFEIVVTSIMSIASSITPLVSHSVGRPSVNVTKRDNEDGILTLDVVFKLPFGYVNLRKFLLNSYEKMIEALTNTMEPPSTPDRSPPPDPLPPPSPDAVDNSLIPSPKGAPIAILTHAVKVFPRHHRRQQKTRSTKPVIGGSVMELEEKLEKDETSVLEEEECGQSSRVYSTKMKRSNPTKMKRNTEDKNCLKEECAALY